MVTYTKVYSLEAFRGKACRFIIMAQLFLAPGLIESSMDTELPISIQGLRLKLDMKMASGQALGLII